MKKVVEKFNEIFGIDGKKEMFFTPGRVNLIGEHIDYNGGYVFPCALNIGTYAVVRGRDDRKFRMYSMNFPKDSVIEFEIDNLKKQNKWADYCMGMVDVFIKAGHNIEKGLDIVFYGNIPNGAGLSSSASLEVLMGTILRDFIGKNDEISMIDVVKFGQRAENEFIGVSCGIMDQFAVGMGKKDRAILLNCETLEYKYAPFNLCGVSIVIMNTNKRRGLADSKYNERRESCEGALKDIQEAGINIKNLCELSVLQFENVKDKIKSDEARKRARHAVSENERVLESVEALENNDIKRFGELMVDSHNSLRDDYEVTGFELDTIVRISLEEEGVIGARMTGAGFGGCAVALVETDSVKSFIKNVGEKYEKETSLKGAFYVVEVSDGSKKLVDIDFEIEKLIHFLVKNHMMDEEDIIYSRNVLLDLFKLDEMKDIDYKYVEESCDKIYEILNRMCDYAVDKGIIGDSITERDLFDARIMGGIIPRPSEVIKKFNRGYVISPKWATDKYYEFSKNTNYIRVDRIQKNKHWVSKTPYGEMEITINLSKPEKDPRDIARAKNAPQSSYPKCFLCKENEGYAGRMNHPGRENHRIIPIELTNEKWYLQYSPYSYYNEHSIIFSEEHRPMKISGKTFERLLEFVEKFPHYFLGSNADLPIVGGSILSHDHFQGGCHDFPMALAEAEETYEAKDYPRIKIEKVRWPMSVIRLRSEDRKMLVELGTKILSAWREYSDKKADIISHTDGVPHNTITPIARMKGNEFELDLVLRNNRTSEKYPLGIFHPHEEYHHIKKENIGLIEVMGLAVLPGRLKEELKIVSSLILEEEGIEKIKKDKRVKKHAPWVEKFSEKYEEITKENVEKILEDEVGTIFSYVLSDAGVFKKKEDFEKFIKNII